MASIAVVTALTVKQRINDPDAPSVSPQGTSGATSYDYKIVHIASDGTTTAASAAGTTAIGNATLSGTNFLQVSWVAPSVASGETVLTEVYRVSGGATQGKIGTVADGVTSFNDTGLAGDGSTPPTSNTTGVGDWVSLVAYQSLSVQVTPSSGWVASIDLEVSSDLVAIDKVDSVDESNRWIEQINGTYMYLRAKMTSYTSGVLPAVNIIGRP